MAVSATAGADEKTVRGGQLLSVLSAGPLLLCSLLSSVLRCSEARAEILSPAGSVSSKVFPGVCADFKRLEVPFADIFETQLWTSLWSCAIGKLAIQQILGDSAIFHTADMTKPANSALLEKCEHTGKSNLVEDFIVRYFVRPLNVEDAS